MRGLDATFTCEGCPLFVEQRQYKGNEQPMLAWPGFTPEPRMIDLSEASRAPDGVLRTQYAGDMEGFLLACIANMNGEMLARHDWFRLPPDATLTLTARSCTLYRKENLS